MHRQARIDTAGGAVEYLGTRGLSKQIKGVPQSQAQGLGPGTSAY